MLNLWDPPLPLHSLIFEKFEKSTAVPDMAPEPLNLLKSVSMPL